MQELLTVAFIALPATYALMMAVDFVQGLRHLMRVPQIETTAEIAIAIPQMPDPWELPLDETVVTPTLPTGWVMPTLRLLPPAAPVLEVTEQPERDYSTLSIRQLKKLAGERKIPKYSSLTKAQLIERLTA